MDTCPFCGWDDEQHECCPAYQETTGFVCTRRDGHRGQHVACGGDGNHVMATWDNDGDDE